MIGIYKITNPVGEIYIGQSINIPIRWKSYKSNKAPKQPKLNQSFLKYGLDNHVFEIVTECDYCELNAIENYYINFFDSYKIGLNSSDGRYIAPTKRKSKEEKAIEWQAHLDKQLLKQQSRDFEKEERIRKLRQKRTLRYRN